MRMTLRMEPRRRINRARPLLWTWNWLSLVSPYFPKLFLLMIKNIMIWNCHGASNKSFVSQVRIIINDLNLDMLVLLETRIARNRGEIILQTLTNGI